jgi:hypothetical protein
MTALGFDAWWPAEKLSRLRLRRRAAQPARAAGIRKALGDR